MEPDAPRSARGSSHARRGTRTRRAFLTTAGVVGVIGLAGCSGAGGPGTPTTREPTGTVTTPSTADGFRIDAVATNLEVPWDLAFAGRKTLYYTERPGRIGRLDLETGTVTTLATLADTAATGESGLLGIALHPDFPDPPDLFVHQTYDDGGLHDRILRYSVDGDRATRTATLLDGIPGASIHDGGRLRIGPDRTLYATCGDAAEGANAQDPSSPAGKILRLNLDGSIPADNPREGNPLWSLGHRNPEGIAWHPDTGRCYATEHGPSGHDEVNRIEKGANYGWPRVTGTAGAPDYVPPILTSGADTWAPSGAAFYAGDAFDFVGDLLFVTLGFSPGGGRRSLHRVRFGADGTGVVEHDRYLTDEFGRLRGIAVGPDGAVYLTTSNRDGRGDPASADDRILRLRAA